MEITFAYTILYVENVPKTIDFYSNVFGLEKKFLTPELDYGELKSGATTLAFANFDLGQSNFKLGYTKSNLTDKPFGFELAFTTDQVEELVKKAVDHGGVKIAETMKKPWGQTVGYIRDINGFIIEICTPIP